MMTALVMAADTEFSSLLSVHFVGERPRGSLVGGAVHASSKTGSDPEWVHVSAQLDPR